jgi:hypothetical protein
MMFIGGLSDGLLQTIANGLASLMLTALVGLCFFSFKAIRAVLRRIDHLDKCLDDVKKRQEAEYDETVIFRTGVMADQRASQAHVTQLEKDYAGVTGYLKGVFNLKIDAALEEITPSEGLPKVEGAG